MKKISIIILFLFLIVFFSVAEIEEINYNSTFIVYEDEKTEFIASKAYEDFFLVKNIPLNDILLEKVIENFIKKKYSNVKQEKYIRFYKYTWWGTDYFLDNEEHDGGPTSYIFLSNYDEENIANFFISKCKTDTTKLVGELYFYNMKHKNPYKPDTLIYHCK